MLSGPVADQSALHGLLVKIRDLDLPLIALQCEVPSRTGPTGQSALTRRGRP